MGDTTKSGLTKVKGEKFLKIVEKLGLKCTKQTSNYRVEDAAGARRFYIPTTKSVHRIDVSGFTHELATDWDRAYPGKKAPTGHVKQVVNFAQEEELVLRSFYKMAKSIASAPAAEPAPEEVPAEAPAAEPIAQVG